MHLSLSEAKELILPVLAKKGFSAVESDTIYSTLLWAQKRGSSQGFNKLFGWRFDKNPKAYDPKIIKSSPSMVQIDAGLNSNVLACSIAVDEIIKNISDQPIFVAGINNTNNSCGALGYYTEKLAKNNLVAIMMASADPGVSAFGGHKPVFGTNPISIAVPQADNPILLDMSTAALTWGDLLKYETEGKSLPEGMAFDEKGQPTTDPKKAQDGWVATFDRSYKSSGLALMIQILAGPLVGSLYSTDYNHCQYGTLIIAINPAAFGDPDVFIKRVSQMVADIRSTGPSVFTPGEQGYKKSSLVNESGQIVIDDNLYQKIKDFLEK